MPLMQEEWRKIQMFPDYSVSDTGSVRNDNTGNNMTKLVNAHGVVHVGLTKDKTLHKRSLSLLVAEAFIPRPNFQSDTAINLDGDRFNNRVDNLLWRPRWFARRYFQQFRHGTPSIVRPVEIVETQDVFMNSWEAATELGVLDIEIAESVMLGTYVWPLFQRFKIIKL
jgi:hypothetical protein